MNFRFYALAQQVRFGTNLSEQDSIACYVHWALERAKSHLSQSQTRAAHLDIVNLLMETICDPLVAKAWRQLCYVHIKRLMPLLYEILSERQFSAKVNEIELVADYFLNQHISAS